MNIHWIVVLYKTPQADIDRLTSEITQIDPSIKLVFIDNSLNQKGYAYGVNQGIQTSMNDQTDIFIVSNPDISVAPISRQDIVDLTTHFDIGGFALKQNRITYYGGEIDKWKMSGGLIKNKPLQRHSVCDFVSGSLMVLKREVIDTLGFFDESYEMYYEDVDYCIRANRAGLKVGIDSEATYEHFETSDENPKKNEWLAKNRKKILWRYGNWLQKLREAIINHVTSNI